MLEKKDRDKKFASAYIYKLNREDYKRNKKDYDNRDKQYYPKRSKKYVKDVLAD